MNTGNRMTFEEFALNHKVHQHCAGCGACMLNPQIAFYGISPVWCVGCVQKIEKNLPEGANPPWHGGIKFIA